MGFDPRQVPSHRPTSGYSTTELWSRLLPQPGLARKLTEYPATTETQPQPESRARETTRTHAAWAWAIWPGPGAHLAWAWSPPAPGFPFGNHARFCRAWSPKGGHSEKIPVRGTRPQQFFRQHGPAGSVGIGKKLRKALAKGTESIGDRALAHGPQALKESAAGS